MAVRSRHTQGSQQQPTCACPPFLPLPPAVCVCPTLQAKLKELVAASRPGDVLFFHFSGHGTQVPDDGESDGYDEAICP